MDDINAAGINHRILKDMEVGKTLYVTNRTDWRRWLAKHYKTESEIWLVYYRKATGKPRISYDAAVEEALCYGWIDSIEKRVDDERFAQRFSPRRKKSAFSQPNRERVERLIAKKKMTRAGLAAIAHAFDPAQVSKKSIQLASDVKAALKANAKTWRNFQRFPDSYKRIRIAYIESQRHHGEDQFRRSLQNFVRKTSQGKQIGYVKVGD